MAGYSKTALPDKLGIKEDMKIMLIDEPPEYFDLIGKSITAQLAKAGERPDFIHLFVTSKKAYEKQLEGLLSIIRPTTIIWVSWYKKSSGIATDINEDLIRSIALKTILVDVKVCAVSDLWSGLKLVVRKENRNFF